MLINPKHIVRILYKGEWWKIVPIAINFKKGQYILNAYDLDKQTHCSIVMTDIMKWLEEKDFFKKAQ